MAILTKWSLGSILVAIVVSSLGFWRAKVGHPQLDYDFSVSRDISKVSWPETKTGDWFALTGTYDLRVRFPGGASFAETVRDVYISRTASNVTEFEACSEPMSIGGAYSRAKEIASEWRLDTPRFEHFQYEARRGSLSTYAAEGGKDPVLTLELIPSLAGDDRPWCLKVSAWWQGDAIYPPEAKQ